MNYRELFKAIQQRPGMYGLNGSFQQFCVFLEGCNAGTGWSLLAGFREWLVVQLGEVHVGNNLAWPALIPLLTQPGVPALFPDQPDIDKMVIATLFRLLDSFLDLRHPRDVHERVHHPR